MAGDLSLQPYAGPEGPAPTLNYLMTNNLMAIDLSEDRHQTFRCTCKTGWPKILPLRKWKKVGIILGAFGGSNKETQ